MVIAMQYSVTLLYREIVIFISLKMHSSNDLLYKKKKRAKQIQIAKM